MKVTTSIDINAPITKVFDTFSDLGNAAERIDGIQSIEVLEGSPQMGVGTKWKETRVMFGKEATETMWVTEHNQNRNYVVEAESNNTKYRSEYIFTEADGGTRVDMTFEGVPQTAGAKFLGMIFSFMAGSMKKMLLADMQNLKEVCEQN